MINIKTRLKNGATLTALISTLALLGNQIAAFFGVDYSSQIEQLVNIAGTVLLILSGLGVITDPNTKGVKDSELAKTYDKPRDDKDPEQAATFVSDIDNKDNEENVVEDGIKTPVEFSKEDDNEDIDPYHMDEDETFFKDESKPYGVDWDEEAVQENVDNENITDKEVSKEEDK